MTYFEYIHESCVEYLDVTPSDECCAEILNSISNIIILFVVQTLQFSIVMCMLCFKIFPPCLMFY